MIRKDATPMIKNGDGVFVSAPSVICLPDLTEKRFPSEAAIANKRAEKNQAIARLMQPTVLKPASKDYISFVKSPMLQEDKIKAAKRDRKAKDRIDPESILIVATRKEARKKDTAMSYAFGKAAEIALINTGVNPYEIRRNVLANHTSKKKTKDVRATAIEYRTKFKREGEWIAQADGSFIRIDNQGAVEFYNKQPEDVQEHTFMSVTEQATYDNFVKKGHLIEQEVHCG